MGSVGPGDSADPRLLAVSCADGTSYGSSIRTNARGTWIYADDFEHDHWGFARLERPGRWAIYQALGRRLLGFAKQRTARRWDVYDNRSFWDRLHAGPKWPQAATALLIMCGY